jgi:hypothetical protein
MQSKSILGGSADFLVTSKNLVAAQMSWRRPRIWWQCRFLGDVQASGSSADTTPPQKRKNPVEKKKFTKSHCEQ